VIGEGRYQQGYFAVQKAYEAILKRPGSARLENIHLPSLAAFAANASELQESLNSAFEMLVRQRTEVLCSYKTRLEHANAELLNLSITDPLTGLLNRREFEKSLKQEVARARRCGPLSLLMIDLDLFKIVNDTYGHLAGDEVLKAVAEVLKSCCRNTDVCARLGGDEFAIILPHSDEPGSAAVRNRIARRIAGLRIPVAGGQSVTVSLSIGIGTMPGDADDVSGLMAAADAAMYRAKQAALSVAGIHPPAR
jgi:diguanylate cyclase (GGDEF)-like protein